MSIFSRIFKIGQAAANQVLDNLEKPEVMLEQAIRDKEKQIKELRESVAACIASEKRTMGACGKEKKQAEIWESKAEAALKAGREDLAVKALSRAKEHQTQAASLEQNWLAQKSDVEKLKIDLQKEVDRLEEYRRNKNFVVAQSQFANAKKSVNQARTKVGRGNADDLMSRMREKAERASYEADAMAELAESGSSLEKEFDDIGASAADAEVQDKLAAMKAKLGK